ncbi:MAG: tetratricopeptide repeat protein [Rhodospirillales bacterium]
MSFILDALKKSEMERQGATASKGVSAVHSPQPETRRLRLLIAASALVLGATGFGAFYWLQGAGQAPQPPIAAEQPPPPQDTVNETAKPETKRDPEPQPVETEAAATTEAPKAEPQPQPPTAMAKAGTGGEPEETKAVSAPPPPAGPKPSEPASIPQPAPQTASSPRPVQGNADDHNKRGRAFENEGLYDRAIEEYTQAILLDPELAEAYLGRAWAHEANGNHDLAVRNYTRAIEIDPLYAEAYMGRGWAYEQSGDNLMAIKEYGRAIESMPNYTDAYFSRGILNFHQSELTAAARDFSSAFENGASGLRRYALLWLYLARTRSGEDGREELERRARFTNLTPWPGVIVKMYLEKASTGQVLAATKSSSPQKQLNKESVAFFFLGQYHLVRDEKDKAVEYFKKTLKTGVTSYRQYGAAREELRKMGRL